MLAIRWSRAASYAAFICSSAPLASSFKNLVFAALISSGSIRRLETTTSRNAAPICEFGSSISTLRRSSRSFLNCLRGYSTAASRRISSWRICSARSNSSCFSARRFAICCETISPLGSPKSSSSCVCACSCNSSTLVALLSGGALNTPPTIPSWPPPTAPAAIAVGSKKRASSNSRPAPKSSSPVCKPSVTASTPAPAVPLVAARAVRDFCVAAIKSLAGPIRARPSVAISPAVSNRPAAVP